MVRLLSSSRFFAALLFAVCAYVVHSWIPIHNGDVAEYTLTTLAVANHGTPDVRLSDLREGQRRLPELATAYSEIDKDIQQQPGGVHLPFAKGLGEKIYAIHFFAYSALAAIPFKLLPLAGLDPFKCYLVVNIGFVALLGLALRRALGDNLKAACALGLFLTCGVWSYLRWTSPEVMSAAALLHASSSATMAATPITMPWLRSKNNECRRSRLNNCGLVKWSAMMLGTPKWI